MAGWWSGFVWNLSCMIRYDILPPFLLPPLPHFSKNPQPASAIRATMYYI